MMAHVLEFLSLEWGPDGVLGCWFQDGPTLAVIGILSSDQAKGKPPSLLLALSLLFK